MSTDQKSTLNPAEAANPKGPLTPEEFLVHLRELRERVQLPEEANAPPSLRRRLGHVDPNFVQASINAAGTTPEVQTVLGRTEAELRADVDESNRWTAVGDEGRALLMALDAANLIRRQRIGLASLQTYQICRQMARDDRHATRLAVHLAEMKRLNRFGRARRKPAEPELDPLEQQPAKQ